ncbi:DUF2273 domain-containing protein [Pediococcus acidilactici]|uniref:DUF2273 domain-containing protein n=1 Tax=Pediococcus acidilactici TaxID=1254 RepID=UPI001324796D|nr:DUF2273 domain-containing protein [Pediococcus acidilactici]KAF0336591.1 DUF2273 domain-containing protein [Pediococcus acidilactici]KAF0345942.1 DUF2273 domain-containing protein [Pediococcus acidilactici]KAF0355447.1 DUF2273 domain-containing protein [Pediococcus acidilactici]KAF0359828.1 DUF2273 domain-containing protein [Pediococcus acidilactici]KAF0364755.1 DUF2273 domain-containing protein [Pediococcus acidilactici]
MKSEVLGAIIAMIFGIIWVTSGFGSAVLVGLLALIGFLLGKYGRSLLSQLISEVMSALNMDRKQS